MREYFIKTVRIGFSKWNNDDINLASQLWGEEEVTRFICSTGKFTQEEIANRLNTEIRNHELYHIQYWPIFELSTDELIGCCGIRPYKSEKHFYELGFHLRKKYWGQGDAAEAANAAIDYSFHILNAKKLYAGHHPENKASEKLLMKLGFQFIGKEFYIPTGLYHPLYEMVKR